MNNVYHSGFANPFLPLNIYIPDGEPKVFEGRVYLYGSKDMFGGEYCSHKFHVYSAPVDNLEEWTDHGPVLASTDEYEGEGVSDGVFWSDGLLWAPDAVRRGKWYYLYFCLSDGTEGVAKSRKPYGPFTDAKQVTMGGKPIEGIDPSVFQERDAFFYTWGQARCHMAKLNKDMCTLDETTYIDALISNEDGKEGFHEASSLRKIGEKYCIIYASEYKNTWPNRGENPTSLDYAVSDQLTGPYLRSGRIIDNTGIDPSTWNNHGSILKIKGQWYIFYHASSNDSKYTRRARVERIRVDEENGTIKQTEMTSSGFAYSLNPRKETQAAWAYKVTGGAFFTEKENFHPMVRITSGCSASYRYLDFGITAHTWTLTFERNIICGGMLYVLINGKVHAKITLEGKDINIQTVQLSKIKGLADVTLRFEASHKSGICELYRFWMCCKE